MDPLKELKGLDAGRQLALVKKLGGRDIVNAILRGEKKVKVEDAFQLLFDKRGRRIPEGLSTKVCDDDRAFKLNQPKLETGADYADRIARLHKCLSVDTRIRSAELFKNEVEDLLGLIRNNPLTSKILNGIWLPVIMPQIIDDLGTTLVQYLTAVERSYIKTFSKQRFFNKIEDFPANEVSIVDGSRHEQLIEQMKKGPVIGIYFPNQLQGFSKDACREQMSTLPKGFILSGLDIPIAMIMYPDVLAYDISTPGYELNALAGQSSDNLFYFKTALSSLFFETAGRMASANGKFSGGLLFVG